MVCMPSGNVTITNNQFVMPCGDVEVQGVFAPITYTVTADTSQENYGYATGGGKVWQNASVTVTATPNSGCHFVKWTENGSDRQHQRKLYLPAAAADGALVAVFEGMRLSPRHTPYPWAQTCGGGTVSGGGTYDENTAVTVTATPNSGCHFVKWTRERQRR